MIGSALLVLAAICVFFVALGVWAVAQIFPAKPMRPTLSHEKHPRQRDHQSDGLDK
jgi:hypothetical protein